jgi:hypothetical protein
MTPRRAKQVVNGLNNKDREVGHIQVIGRRGTDVLVRALVQTGGSESFGTEWVVFSVRPNGLTQRMTEAMLKEWRTAQRRSNAAKQRKAVA